MLPDDPNADDGRPPNQGGRPPRSSEEQLRRDAIFLAFGVLDELGAVPTSGQAPMARLANLLAAEDTDASFSIDEQVLMLSFIPPANLNHSKLQHRAKYTAQRVNDTVKGKNWNPTELSVLRASSEAVVLMFLAPIQQAVDVLAGCLVQEGWPTAPVSRLASLAKLWGARRPGYLNPDAQSLQAMASFLAAINKPDG